MPALVFLRVYFGLASCFFNAEIMFMNLNTTFINKTFCTEQFCIFVSMCAYLFWYEYLTHLECKVIRTDTVTKHFLGPLVVLVFPLHLIG